MTRLTPLAAAHEAAGASMTDFAGWRMPLWYDSGLKEHAAVRGGAGAFDLSHMGRLRVAGPGAARTLDARLTGDMGAMDEGRAKYTLLTADDGGILDDLVVYRLGVEDFLVVANAANASVVLSELRAVADGADISDETESGALIAVQGPASAGILAELGVDGLSDLLYYRARPASVAGVRGLLARTGYTGEDGFELFVPASAAEDVWRAAVAAGARPCGLAARDTLRLEAGMALYGHELTRETNPYEARLSRVVALGKPFFTGKTALEQAAARPPARALTGFAAQGRRAPRAGNPILGPDGGQVGEVTSGVLSPTLGHPIALGYLDAGVTASGLAAQVRAARVPVEIVDIPFYRRPRASAKPA